MIGLFRYIIPKSANSIELSKKPFPIAYGKRFFFYMFGVGDLVPVIAYDVDYGEAFFRSTGGTGEWSTFRIK